MAPQSFQLVMQAGPSPGKSYPLSKNEVTIGRETTSDIIINSTEVSRKHCRLSLQGGLYVVEDLGSTNGTYVNGQRLMAPHTLRPGELLLLGEQISLSFEIAQLDPNATMISPGGQVVPATQVSPSQPPPAYAGQVPPGPEMPDMAEPVERKVKPWILAGAGCLVVVMCLLVVGVAAFDLLDLYCTPPFDAFFGFIYTCP